jgi:hypothetical protein
MRGRRQREPVFLLLLSTGGGAEWSSRTLLLLPMMLLLLCLSRCWLNWWGRNRGDDSTGSQQKWGRQRQAIVCEKRKY